MILALYSVLLAAGLVAYRPVLFLRRTRARARGAPMPVALRDRGGDLAPDLPSEPRCWVHAVSVGEALAAVPLVEGIRARWPALAVVVTTVTPTGAAIVRERLGAGAAHRYFPIDLPRPVARALDAVRPRFFIAMETELWPNFLRALARRRIPAMIANGRISDRSFRRYRWIRFLMARVLADIAVFAMQSAEDARRIIALGAPPERVRVTGSLKSDLLPEAADARPRWTARLGLEPDDLLLVAGSTHRGEEEAVLDAFQRLRASFETLRLVLAPRHLERLPEVEALVAGRRLGAARRSRLDVGGPPAPVVLLDTIGELAEIYGVAALAFVGGSLVPVGGHNVLEPALRRKPVLFGPHVENFRESASLLLSAGAAIMVHDALELERALEPLLKSPARRAEMGDAGRRAVESRQGAVKETLGLVAEFLVRP
ncbi:MAG: 3-deoxy-D-manno-octulosonic acid transferase [Candidatus Rokubacteria bacterium]|nr:3-deoxy-D-manno-octulosonic acid transferase [Candidatus Rokubacteria bacterium]